MSIPQTDSIHGSTSQIHRAIVQYSSTTTGEIQVIIPSVTGLDTTVPVSYFGREAHPFENDWVVPNVGSSIVVCREDEDYTSVYWLNTTYNPVRADVGEVNPSNYNFGPSGSESLFDLSDWAGHPTSAGLYLGSTYMGYHTGSNGSDGWRTYMDYTGKFYLGGTSGSLQWDGSTLTILGTAVIGGTAASTVVSGAASGGTAAQPDHDWVDGTVGGWVITTGLLTGGTSSHKIELDQGNKRISAGGGRAVMLAESSGRVAIGIDADADNAPAYNSSGGDVVMERTSGGASRFSCGNKLTWDGSNLAITGTITGGLFQTAASGDRVTLDGAGGRIEFDVSSEPSGYASGYMNATLSGTSSYMVLRSPKMHTGTWAPGIVIYGHADATSSIDFQLADHPNGAGLTINDAGVNVSNANFGVGNSNPSYKLDVQGTGRFTGVLTLGSSIDGPQDFIVGNGEGEQMLFQGSSNITYFMSNGVYRAYFNASGDFLPYQGSTYNLGSSSLHWEYAYIDIVSVSNEVRLGNGTAGDPSLTFSSDDDTGVYRKNEDQIGVSTGGSERGYFSSAGWVGSVVGNASSATNATNATYIGVAANSANATRYPIFATGTSGNLQPLADAGLTYNPSANSLGIGTTASSSYSLSVSDGSSDGIFLFKPSVLAMGSNHNGYSMSVVGGIPDGVGMGGEIRLGGGSRGDGDVNVVQFKQGGIERMRINNGGNIGMGSIFSVSNAPAANLHVSSGTSGDCEVIIEADTDNNNENDNPRLIFEQDGGIQESAICQQNNYLELMNSVSLSGGIRFSTGSTNGYTNAAARLIIDSSGYIYPQSLTAAAGTGLNVNASFGMMQKDTSSLRYKTLASETVASQMSLDTIDSLEPKVFAYKAAPEFPHVGLIAEDAHAVSPYLVLCDNNDGDPLPDSVYWPAVTSLLINTVKDLRTRLLVAESRIATLEAS